MFLSRHLLKIFLLFMLGRLCNGDKRVRGVAPIDHAQQPNPAQNIRHLSQITNKIRYKRQQGKHQPGKISSSKGGGDIRMENPTKKNILSRKSKHSKGEPILQVVHQKFRRKRPNKKSKRKEDEIMFQKSPRNNRNRLRMKPLFVPPGYDRVTFDPRQANLDRPYIRRTDYGTADTIYFPFIVFVIANDNESQNDINYIIVPSIQSQSRSIQTTNSVQSSHHASLAPKPLQEPVGIGTSCPTTGQILDDSSDAYGYSRYMVERPIGDFMIVGCQEKSGVVVAVMYMDYVGPNTKLHGLGSGDRQASTSPSALFSFSLTPSFAPSKLSSEAPSDKPSLHNSASSSPSMNPSNSPSLKPSAAPLPNHSLVPSALPTQPPTVAPSLRPTTFPAIPLLAPPGVGETQLPTMSFSSYPSEIPSEFPSTVPSDATLPSVGRLPESRGSFRWASIPTSDFHESYDDEGFGASLALSQDGGILTVGAFRYSGLADSGGRLLRFVLTKDEVKSTTVELTGESQDFVGFQVASSGDGNRQAIYKTSTGAIEIVDYSELNHTFRVISSFVPSADIYPDSSDFDMSGDGNWLAFVGEDYNDSTKETRLLLFLYAFDESTQEFHQHGKVIEVDRFYSEDWGDFDISVSDAGTLIAVSHIGESALVGHVWVFEQSDNGLTQVGLPIFGNDKEDGFGRDVEVLETPTGQRILGVSVPNRDIVRVYILRQDDWSLLGSPINGAELLGEDCEFGYSISLNSQANRILVGAPKFGEKRNGAVLAFELVLNEWLLLGQALGGLPGSSFGESVAFDETGAIFAVGAPDQCTSKGECGGQVFLFHDAAKEEKNA